MALSIDQARNLPALQESSLLDGIQRAAADPNTDIAKMQALLDMGLRLESIKAERAFNEAIRATQEKIPPIKRSKSNKHTSSTYADLEAVNRIIVPIYTTHGLSLSFGTADCPLADHYRVTCRVSHVGGHSANYQHDVPTDAAGAKGTANKNPTQAAGSALSYGRRYLAALIFNLTTTDDDDANTAGDTVWKNEAEFKHYSVELQRMWGAKDAHGLRQLWDELTSDQQSDIWREFGSVQRREMKELLAQTAPKP